MIGILDTGVDWQHPDLAANIWTNEQEIPDNGIDDDGNGLIDDVRGWDYINNDNNPIDDNSHGTHVAGIAAAVGNNGIGIAGANWKAKIMPIKVFQSSGRGDAATIAKGVIYAASKGATVINMSFGSYSESLTLKNALANAYTTAVLVAAAGNDGLCIGPGLCPDRRLGQRMYPGAYSFVLGVEANKQISDLSGIRAGFSNFDQDGPVFSNYPDLENYELKAPGVGILSCVPGGNYREYSGTSMAAPLVAGAVTLYRKQRPAESQELLFGNLINSLGQHIDLEKALNIIPEPKLDIVSYAITDTIDGDRDGRPDAGETIQLKVKVRNTWGQANDVKVGIEFGEFEDHSTTSITTSEASVGSVSAYGSKENTIAIKIKLASNINDGRDIVFNLKTWYGDHLGEKKQTIVINVENGMELKGIISKDLTLYPNKQYIIADNIVIPQGITLTIKPGTTLKFGDGKSLIVGGNIIAIGLRDSLITFTKRDLGQGWKWIKLEDSSNFKGEFTVFENSNSDSHSLYVGGSNLQLSNCLFRNNNSQQNICYFGEGGPSIVEKSCFYDNSSTYDIISLNKTFINNNVTNNTTRTNWLTHAAAIQGYYLSQNSNFYKNNIFSNSNAYSGKELIISTYYGLFNIIKLDSLYYGTTNENKINDRIYDFQDTGTGTWFDISKKMIRPSRVAHAHVWKVLVNGKDAQDEYDQLDPLGVGKQKLEVYFNRAMDTKYPPTVSMGVRYPYSQTALAEDGSWSADSTKYTVYGTVGLNTSDGTNTIRVTGAKDMDHFEIPIEDRRFRVIVNAAGSASAEFQATPGLGKVGLEWNNAKLSDGLGFNMYRMEQIDETTLSKPVMINSSLITDTLYTDFAVTPNKKYYYYYKILRTNLTETDSSKVVATTPFTAAKGDANGDLSVNVLDVTAIVAFLLNNKPQPFIIEAADLNSDGSINVLDIVGVVNKVLGNKSALIATSEQVKLYMQNDTLFADVPVAIGGVQFDISGVSSAEEIVRLKALEGFESAYNLKDNSLMVMYYSMSGKTIPAGKRIPLLKMKKGTGITNVIFGDKSGSAVQVNYLATGIWNLRENLNDQVAELGQNYPNPLNKQTTIPIRINETVDEAVIHIFNVMGQEVDIIRLNNPTIGEHLLNWNSGIHKGLMAYLLEIRRGNQRFICPVKKMVIK